MRFTNQVALITGASTGIGRQIALALARNGARVGVTGRSADKLRLLREEIESLGVACLSFPFDIRDRSAVFGCVAEVEKGLGPIDILVNNAGMGVGGAVHEVSWEDIQYQVEVNIYGVIHATQAVLKGMIARRRGLIANISSVVGKASLPYSGYYSATKFALTALSDAWRVELRPYNIRVLNVCPGATSDTEFHKNARGVDGKLPRHYEMTSAEVARRTLQAAANGKREIILTAGGRLFVAANRFVPGLTYAVISRLMPYLRRRSETEKRA